MIAAARPSWRSRRSPSRSPSGARRRRPDGGRRGRGTQAPTTALACHEAGAARRKARGGRAAAVQRGRAEGLAPRRPRLTSLPRRRQGSSPPGEARAGRVRRLPRRRAEAVRRERARPEGRRGRPPRRRAARAATARTTSCVPSTPGSPTSTMEIPRLCGGCHHEGSPVSLTRHIPQTNILDNYTDSIHGEGLFKKGLTVTAVCTSCHTAHFVLPHTDPRSSIAKQNIAKTCTQCHAQIETVHRKVIRGELWEKQPHLIPACVDCHSPHKVRKVFYTQGMADQDCLRCHGEARPARRRAAARRSRCSSTGRARGLAPRPDRLRAVPHRRRPRGRRGRAARSWRRGGLLDLPRRGRSTSTSESTHGSSSRRAARTRPRASDCHGTHGTLEQERLELADVLAQRSRRCAAAATAPARRRRCATRATQKHIVENYVESIHGKGLLQSGLTVTANCVDCHTRPRRAAGQRPALERQSGQRRRRPARSATAASTSCSRRASTRPR